MNPLLLALALAAPGCPEALARAGALDDTALAAEAPALIAALGPGEAPLAAVQDEIRHAAGAAGADRAAAGARARRALDRHCALAAQPRLPPASPAARARAAEILDQADYRAARVDREALTRRLLALWQRILDLLQTGEAQEYASFSRALFLAAAAAAAALGGLALLRRRAARTGATATAAAPPVTPAPDARLDAARAAAARGDAAGAIRLALLAALGALERDGVIPRGRSFTNRELVDRLRGARPGRPALERPARTLAALHDRAVYGGLPAGPEEARAAIEAARALGTEGAP